MFFLIFSQIVFVRTSSNQSDSPPLIFHHSPRHLILSSLETEQELVHDFAWKVRGLWVQSLMTQETFSQLTATITISINRPILNQH